MRSGRRGWILGCAGVAAASLWGATPGALASQTSTGSTVIPSTAPLSGATLAFTAPAPAARAAEVHVFLGQDQAGLQALDEQVSDPHSSSDGQFLTPAQVASRFGASTDEIAAVASWLTTQGLHVTDQSPYLVSATGRAASIAQGFDTTVVPARSGQVTNATPMSMPSSLAGQVVTVTVTGTKPVPEKPKFVAAPRQAADRGNARSTTGSSRRPASPRHTANSSAWRRAATPRTSCARRCSPRRPASPARASRSRSSAVTTTPRRSPTRTCRRRRTASLRSRPRSSSPTSRTGRPMGWATSRARSTSRPSMPSPRARRSPTSPAAGAGRTSRRSTRSSRSSPAISPMW